MKASTAHSIGRMTRATGRGRSVFHSRLRVRPASDFRSTWRASRCSLRPRMRRLGFLMFVLSGAAALVFEVALQRSLTRAFGVSALATSTVLAGWMAGLALGAILFGRLADRSKRPLTLYAWLEVGIGLCALVMPFVVPLAIDGFANLARGRTHDEPIVRIGLFAMSFGITLVPTLLMGGTLPPVARALSGKSGLASGTSEIARLYTANVLGAAIGAGLGSYVFLPAIGLSASMWLGAAFNLAAAGAGFWLSKRVVVDEPVVRSESARAPLSLLGLSAWSGDEVVSLTKLGKGLAASPGAAVGQTDLDDGDQGPQPASARAPGRNSGAANRDLVSEYAPRGPGCGCHHRH